MQIGNLAFSKVPNQAHVNHPATAPVNQIGTGQPQSFMGIVAVKTLKHCYVTFVTPRGGSLNCFEDCVSFVFTE